MAFFTYLLLIMGEPNEEGGYTVNGIAAVIPVLVWLLMTVMLKQTAGATLGNGIARLKPLDADGKNQPDLFQSMKRHLLDPVDMFFFGTVAIIAIKNSPKCQRLGDQWAKTVVVKT